jgi:hypothetical protein
MVREEPFSSKYGRGKDASFISSLAIGVNSVRASTVFDVGF